jgi:hypothetical protein
VLRLAVLHAADLHVEHVDLAVEGADLAVGGHVHGGVGDALVPVAALGDGARHQVDAELARQLSGPADRAPVQWLGAREVVGGGAADVESLRQHDQLGAVRGGGPDMALGRREIPLGVGGRLQLDGGGPHHPPGPFSLPALIRARLTD